MKAMILAAGRGERMRPLTDEHPKPLLKVGGRSLIEHHLLHLQAAGFTDIVINQGWLGEQLPDALGDGSAYGLNIQYSSELSGALETGGGIHRALPLLVDDTQSQFLVVNGDVWCDVDYQAFIAAKPERSLVHLLMVDNPEHNPSGDFNYQAGWLQSQAAPTTLTYSGIGIYHAAMFDGCEAGKFPLAPLIRASITQEQVSAYHHSGVWFDIGTPERLQYLEQLLQS